MSKVVRGIFGVAALVASLSAAQFAVGENLPARTVDTAAASQANLVNRSAKADRPVGVKAVTGSTIVTQLSASDQTSVVVRSVLPAAASEIKISKMSRRPVACEAPASVLSEIAQHLESGRCVT